MSIPKKPFKLTRSLFRRIRKLYDGAIKALAHSAMRSLRRIGKRPRWANAGFALPTTIMVLLVVILLTTALVFRSFDRNKNAVLGRSEQVIQNTSTPALDRAKAKLTALLADPQLPRGTPADTKLIEVMSSDPTKYTFPDETRLKLAFNFSDGSGGNKDSTIQSAANVTDSHYDETLNTAWKYPVDTDGNGLFDAFTLYGLYWRSPKITGGQYERGRNSLEARSLPQETSGVDSACQTAGLSAATAIAEGDWIKQGANLSKSFYVYAATVPITNKNNISSGSFKPAQFENNKKGDKAFSGLEYELDRYRSGLNNTAVWYQDDLVINPGSDLRLNGKIFTNSNLLLGGTPGAGKVRFYQVSSKFSCFYRDKTNSQINIGGNVGTGAIYQDTDQEPATVDLYQGFGNTPTQNTLDASTRSTNSAGGTLVAFNDAAYNKRIAVMKQAALALCAGCSDTNPPTVAKVNATYSDQDLQKSFKDALETSTETPLKVLEDQIEIYLRNRTRRVPYAEIADLTGEGAETGFTGFGVGGTIEPPEDWREPLQGNSFRNPTASSVDVIPTNLPQTNPQTKTDPQSTEDLVGDRVAVGNNLPALWKDPADGKYKGQGGEKRSISGTTWTAGGGNRYRISQVQALDNLGVTERDGFWEQAAASNPSPKNTTPPNIAGGGGLRVITGAGIYVDGKKSDPGIAAFPRDSKIPNKSSFLPEPYWNNQFVDPLGTDPNRLDPVGTDANTANDIPKFLNQPNIIVWPDLMPMTGARIPGVGSANKADIDQDGVEDFRQKGDLLMRAAAVYHYVDAAIANQHVDQAPIACVSSYYDPTNSTTARNPVGLPDVSGGIDTNNDGRIDQLFGELFSPQPAAPTLTQEGAKSNNGVVYGSPGSRSGYEKELRRQARLVFPDGRIVNEPLRTALQHQFTGVDLTFADYSAIDAAICAIAILNGSVTPTEAQIPHGTIKEGSFLDAREIKAIDKTPTDPNYDITKNYDLPLELRQPLEIRTTDIDLGLLAQKTHKSFDSDGDGIDETEYLLPNSGVLYASRDDALLDSSNSDNTLSPTDYKLDPTRRPNAIRLIDGLRLARSTGNQYDKHEKGLILATNLPAYVRGNFNLHLPSPKKGLTNTDTELEEFTQTLDASNWSNFYDRGDASGNTLNKQFACRRGQTLCQGTGDQWRPATILADAITLQSVKFQDGYRSQGDFDLRNSVGSAAYIPDPAQPTITKTVGGSSAAEGFFNNNFVTSADWSKEGASSISGTVVPLATYQTSYLVNGVTPIQRRARVFAYNTEICLKLPVSECKAADWQKTVPLIIPTALNTSQPVPPAALALQRYARRVDFQKTIVNDTSTTPPTQVVKYFYDPLDGGYPQPAQKTPSPIDHALWFRARNNQANGGNPTYASATLANSKLDIFQPPEMKDLDLGIVRGYLAASPTQQISMGDFTTKFPTLVNGTRTFDGGGAPNPVQQRISKIFQAATTPTATSPLAKTTRLTFTAGKAEPNPNELLPDKKTEITGGGVMGVYTIPGSLVLNNARKLNLKGDAGSVYVFIVNGSLTVQQGVGTLDFGQVLPENVYWVVSSDVRVLTGGVLKGNVLSSTSLRLYNNAILEGRALLNAGTITLAPTSKIVPPSGSQPRPVPVTQTQSPDGNPLNSTIVLAQGDGGNYGKYWLQQADSTNYNAAFVSGDSPPRPDERSGGLNNFVRLQENWSGKSVTIKGSFIQQKRSSFATAPFPATRERGLAPKVGVADGSLSILNDTNIKNGYWTGNGSLNPTTNEPPGQIPYFTTPTRQWGFDVGLLSQQPDLFSQKFTQDISKTQSYYRQVGRDDDWIKTLLCAAEPPNPTIKEQRVGDPTTADIAYTKPAVPDDQRPNCTDWVGAPFSSYPKTPKPAS